MGGDGRIKEDLGGKDGGQEVAKIYKQFNKSISFFSKAHGWIILLSLSFCLVWPCN